jgi:RNA polymerase sigma-70 factor, ECF subfamily
VDESELIAAVAAADRASFERLYSLYERRVFQYTLTLVKDTATAEEIVIDTMLAVWDGATRFNRSSRVSTWIFGIARHKAIDAIRRAGRGGKRVAIEEAAEVATAEPGPDDVAQQRAVQNTVGSAIRELSHEHREVLHLAFFEDLPYEEIARLLSLPLNTVKTRVYYAKQKLKAEMQRLTPMETAP